MKRNCGVEIRRAWRPRRFGAAAVALLVLAGCAATKRAADGEGPPPPGEAEAAAFIEERLARERAFDENDRYNLALDHFILARDYERRGMRETAEQLYEVAYDFWPRSPFLRKILADRFIRLEQYGSALALFFREGERLSDLSPEDKRTVALIYLRLDDAMKAAEAIESLGRDISEKEMYSLALLYGSAGHKGMAFDTFRKFFDGGRQPAGIGASLVQMHIGEGNLADAESLAVILRASYPGNSEAASILGTVKYLGRDTSAAAALFNEALALDPQNEDALRTLAHMHVIREEYEEAAAYYRRLAAIEGAGAPYRRGLGLMLFHLKKWDEAEKLLSELIEEKDGQDMPQGLFDLYLYRGSIHSQAKRYGKAAEDFRAAIAAAPGKGARADNEDAWKELCYVYILSKDENMARQTVEEYNAAYPESGAARRFRGYVLNMMKKYDEAAAALREAVEIDSADYYAWFKLGSVFERQKRVDEAAGAFRSALRIRPGDAQVSNYLGYMWADAGMNLDSAKALIEDALKAEPENGAYLDSYAWVFYQMGDYDKALHYMNKAMERIKGDADLKDDPVPYEHLGDIHFKLKDYRAAEAAYKRSLDLKTEEAKRIKERLAEIRTLMRKERR